MSIDERIYPCEKCGLMRTKGEGGTTFTLCDKCWDEHFNTPKVETNIHSFARSQAIEFLKWYKKLKFYSKFGRTTGMLYSLFLAHQAKQKEGGKI